jgi:hypothetical protein
MRLIGYEALTDEPTGICAGLFMPVGKSNEVFIAVSSIEGSTDTTIAGFATVTARRPIYFGLEHEVFEVSIGDPWKDVLLINGETSFGTREELRDSLAISLKILFRDYPFTAVDLFRELPGGKRRDAVGAAYERVAKTIGPSRARTWVVDTYLRNQLLTHLRKKLTHRNASVMAMEALRHLELKWDRTENAILASLSGDGEFDREDIEPLLLLEHDTVALEIVSELPPPLDGLRLFGELADAKLVRHDRPKPILVIPIGKSADLVSRLLLEDSGRTAFLVDVNWPSRMFQKTSVRELGKLDHREFSLVIAVLDANLTRTDHFQFEQLRTLMERRIALPLLIVPTLPKHHPSLHLVSREVDGISEDGPRTMILDTSAVRSPLAMGLKMTSLARRIAELTSIACLLLLSKAHVLESFVRRAHEEGETCVTVSSLPDGPDGPSLPLPSEAVEARTRRKRLSQISEIRASIPMRRRPSFPPGTYELSVSRLRADGIDDLAMAAVTKVLESGGLGDAPRKAEPPAYLRVPLEYPSLASLITVEIDGTVRLLVTAESPSLEVLLVCETHGIQAVRYSDTSTLQQLLRPGENERRWDMVVPADVLPITLRPAFGIAPTFFRAAEHPALLLEFDAWREWAAAYPRHPLITKAKRLVENGSKSESKRRLVAISHWDVRSSIAESDHAISVLQQVSERYSAALGVNRLMLIEPPKQDGVDRWVFRAGRLPITPRRLPEGYSVGDGWIAFDGDRYAAAMVATNIVSTWMRLQKTSSTGLQSRAAANGLNSFPWPEAFSRSREDAIVCDSPTLGFVMACDRISFSELTWDVTSASERAWEAEFDQSIRDDLTFAARSMFSEGDGSEIDFMTRLVKLANMRTLVGK